MLAELKLLLLMQQEVNARTIDLDRARQQDGLTDQQQQELRDLRVEQGRLADLVLDLVPVQDNNEEALLDGLPDLE